jgi:putative spermidine/putrescine transport system ATP-binding protein
VRLEIRALQQQLGLTTVMVTHDQEEALTMADRLVVMSDGKVRQVGTQSDLYERPADLFVADFVGRSTMISGAVTGPGSFRSDGGLVLTCAADATVGPATIALRPERLTLGAAAAGLDNHASGKVGFVSYLGALLDVHVHLNDTDHVVVQIPNRADGLVPAVGDTIEVGWPASACLAFPREAA